MSAVSFALFDKAYLSEFLTLSALALGWVRFLQIYVAIVPGAIDIWLAKVFDLLGVLANGQWLCFYRLVTDLSRQDFIMTPVFLFICIVSTVVTFAAIYIWVSFQPTVTRGRVKASDWGSYPDQAADPDEASVDLAVSVRK